MDYHIYKLSFTTPCRFGSTAGLDKSDVICQADTFFSALANECIAFYGTDKLQILKQSVDKGQFLISDLLPYDEACLFLPKPLWTVDKKNKRESLTVIKTRMGGAKKLKKLQYIPIYDFENYLECMKTGKIYIEEEDDKYITADDIYQKQLIEKVNCRGEESLPYFMEQVHIKANCGLYFIAATAGSDDIKLLDKLLQLLVYTGIGGKRSSGYGKFTYTKEVLKDNNDGEDTSNLYHLLAKSQGQVYMSLSNMIPAQTEIDQLQEGSYRLLPRGGFITDENYSTVPLKRNRYFAVMHGSCFKQPLAGTVIDVNDNGSHPVYRYGKGIYVRLEL
ncbi:type III-A CRISPR-associated RAMP protein Csm4 [Pectinatus sottacetonis]|uniref:type III-A CRISPR-associated RAMP protein Csm4 n=1 Tax=Pectinatus sottacetonis TaxID=1002795 RepID=UPI0018C50D18|nr:type III-A CRISPR-associated RAMP protein Csm4 [Pectinatus sottacetonis]